jgi:predicted ATPase
MNNIDVIIKNFGKIKNATFQVKPFTLIAGQNASGKSFITRALYSIFNSLNKDHLSIEVDGSIYMIRHFVRMLSHTSDAPSRKVLDKINVIQAVLSTLEKNVELVFHQATLVSQITQKDILHDDVEKLDDECEELIKELASIKKYKNTRTYLARIQSTTKRLKLLLEQPNESLSKALGQQLEKSLEDNFLVSSLSKLRNRNATEEEGVGFDFGSELGHINLNSNSVLFELEAIGIDQFQQIDNVVYLESPIYWKIKDVLTDYAESSSDPFLRRRRKHQKNEVKKVPEYILDTFSLLKNEIKEREENKDLTTIKNKIVEAIGGNIQVSDNGDIQFVELDRNNQKFTIDLHQTATGVVSLGVIALLLDKNIIVPNSVLIIDEPEVNLHPAWQQIMVKVLYLLSKAGVRIVMASHSFDMMQCIENLMDCNDQSEVEINDHFSIVQLKDGETINQDSPLFKKLSFVKADLGMPLFDLFLD